jgi:hypothetical protein
MHLKVEEKRDRLLPRNPVHPSRELRQGALAVGLHGITTFEVRSHAMLLPLDSFGVVAMSSCTAHR